MKIFINNPIDDNFVFEGHTISRLSYENFLKKKTSLVDYFKGGYSYSSIFSKLQNPNYLNRLYLERDKDYFQFLNTFYEKYKDYDIIVMNPGVDLVHPEYLYKNFKNSLKIIHCIDDPHQTYSYILPYSWVFDAATYISPSYSSEFSMSEFLKLVGFKSNLWVPHATSNTHTPKWKKEELISQLKKREKKAVYFGNFYKNKIDRLFQLKKILKNNFEIYGKFPLKGFSFFSYSLIKRNPIICFPQFVTNEQKYKIYQKSAVGINMHLSDPSIETGNLRTYELAYNGVAQVVDTSKSSLIKKIFEPDKEILTYESIEECIFQTKKLLQDDDLRYKIALAAYERSIKEYSYSKILSKQIKWFKTLLHQL